MFKTNKGITLIALVITIIILIILAGVSISLVFDQEGIINKAKKAADDMQIAANEESEKLADLLDKIETNAQIIKNNKPNAPVLLTGMTPVKYTMPTEEQMGTTVETTKSDKDWYEYGTTYQTRRWANAVTKNSDNQITGYWVWIPRYAYKITYTDPLDKSKGGVIEVVFLEGTSDNYYDEEGKLKTAQRQKTADEVIDTTKDFTVHPAFTNESNINFANGGWDKELAGIWVAKFEAGYASGNNNAKVVASKEKYTQLDAWVKGLERGTDENGNTLSDGGSTVRNWLDGKYAGKNADGTLTWKDGVETYIKYPVFTPLTYSMNYINRSDSYRISRALTDSNNIYGLVSTNADSHMMKNSEWGAVAYLSHSIYGQNGAEIKINNISLNNSEESVYPVTGCTSNKITGGENITTIEEIKSVTKNNPTQSTNELAGGVYVWNQLTGQNASTTGTIYGIYDISGGALETPSSYIANWNGNLKIYGESMTYENGILKTDSTKYTTVYPHDTTTDNNKATNLDTATQNNFKINTQIYGDAMRETTSDNAGTSNSGWGTSAWNRDFSYYPSMQRVFFLRGGTYAHSYGAGPYMFYYVSGTAEFSVGFRAVLIPMN